MKYEIINSEKKIICGKSIRTNNNAEDVTQKIGSLWHDFFEEKIPMQLTNKADNKIYGVYHNYESDFKGDYDMTVGCCVEDKVNIPQDMNIIEIPAAKYAKFKVEGNAKTAVMEFWSRLWKMDLKRSYTFDYEEYEYDENGGCKINVYIAIK